ncbi:MAG: peptidoglycan recognition family protein [Elusimicrobiota bacterium]|jgi:hypothetical protein
MRSAVSALLLALLLSVPARAEKEGPAFTYMGFPSFSVPSLDAGKEGEPQLLVEASPAADDFSAVIFHGRLQKTAAVVIEGAVRCGGDWGEWTRAEVEVFRRGRFWGRVEVAGEKGCILGLRVLRPQGPGASILFFEVEGVPLDQAAYDISRPRKVSYLAGEPALPTVAIVARREWGARPAAAPYEPMYPELITVHHTEGELLTDPDDALDEMAVIQRYHQRGRGWNDIGYHYLIDGAGRVYRGRPANVVGAHVGVNNEGNIGVSLMGNFMGKRKPTEAQLAALAVLLRGLTHAYGIEPERILGHRDQMKTSCPGTNLYSRLPDLRKAAAEPVPPPQKGPTLTTSLRLPVLEISFDGSGGGW